MPRNPRNPQPNKKKGGNLSAREKAVINELAGSVSIEEIARRLNRQEKVIRSFLEAPAEVDKANEYAPRQFRKSTAWKQLQKEFDEEEQAYFIEQYGRLMVQFRDDILPSEESQIFKAIKYEILMHRNLAEKARIREEFRKVNAELRALIENQEDEDLISARRYQLNSLADIEAKKTEELLAIDSKLQKVMESLKATREQRVSRIESSKQSFLALVRAIQEEAERDRTGKHIELMRRAYESEKLRLSSEHDFGDMVDRPLLNADSIEVESHGKED